MLTRLLAPEWEKVVHAGSTDSYVKFKIEFEICA
jgi:hypothetical protein